MSENDLLKAIEKLKLDLAAKDKAITELEAQQDFLLKEITYVTERLAKLGEKRLLGHQA